MRKLLFALSVFTLLFQPAFAETIAITNAHVHTMGTQGQISSGTIIVRNGTIIQVGKGITPPVGARVIDAQGRIVTPGLYILGTNLAAVEVDLVEQTNDNATASHTLSAAFDISLGIDPDSFVIPVARNGGVTRALITPAHGDADGRELMFAGQAAIISLQDTSSILAKPRVAMMVELGESGAARAGGSRGTSIVALRSDLEDVRWYLRNRRAYNSGSSRDLRLTKPDLEALIPVVQGKMPLIIGVKRASDIRQVIALAKRERLRVILNGAEEGWMVADELATAHIPVLLNPTNNLPSSFEARESTLTNAARLHAAGVVIAFSNADGGHRAREVRYNAGNAAAHGLPASAALEAMTINPARIMREDRQLGTIERGKQADIVIWSGDPLEPLTTAEHVLIKGVVQPTTSRADELAKRYRSTDNPYPPAYRQ